MLDPKQVADKISDLGEGRIDFGAFEDWFRQESQDAELSGAVDAIEDVLSQYHHEGLRGASLNQELANAIRPFVQPAAVILSCAVVSYSQHDDRERTPGISLARVNMIPRKPVKPEVALGTSNSPTWELVPAKALLA